MVWFVCSLLSSLFRFLLAVESESQGEVARTHGARAKNVPESSRDSRMPERKRKRLLRRLVCV